MDAAHNPAGGASLANALRESFASPYSVAVISVLGEKDARGFLKAIDESVVSVVVTQSSSPRAIEAEVLAEIAREILGSDRVEVEPDLKSAIAVAKTMLPAGGENNAIIVSGSITLVGDALILQQKEVSSDE